MTATKVRASAGATHAQALEASATRRATCLFSTDCYSAHDAVESWAASSKPPSTLVTLEWEKAPRLNAELDKAVEALAAAATLVPYPELYASAAQRLERSVDELPTPDGARSIARSIAGVSVAAATKILEACRHGETPKLGRLPRADRVRQLALALDPKQLVIELFVTDPLPPAPGSLLAFGKGADWLAHNTGARVVLVVPQSYMRAGELDHLAYGLDERVNPEPSVANDNAKASSSVAPGIDRGAVGSAEVSPTVRVGAIAGRPHPNSDAEVLLHQKLIVDAELGELFAFNRLIKTKFGLNPRVDLIWEPGQLVIEVDGHPLHSKHGQFCHDRRRDYELMLSGYRVLRLPDAAIVSDPDKILEQIRNVVRYLRENKP